MKLNDLDPNAWSRLATALGEIADEIADETGDGSEWPVNSVAVECWRKVNDATILALMAQVAPRARMADLRAAFQADMRQLGVEEPS